MSSYRNNYVPWNKNSLSYGSSTKPDTSSTKSKYETGTASRPSSRAEIKAEPEKATSKLSYRGSTGAYGTATSRDSSSTREPNKYTSSLTKEPEKAEKSVREKLGEKYAVPEIKATVRDKYAAPEKSTSIRDKYSTTNSPSTNTGTYSGRSDLTTRIKSVIEKKETPPVSYRSLSRAGARSRDPSPTDRDKTDSSNYRHYPRSYTRSTSREPDPLASSTLKYGSRTSSKEDLSNLTSRYGTTRTSRADTKLEEPRSLSGRSGSITSRDEEPKLHVSSRSGSISSREDCSLSRYSTSRHSSKEDLSSSNKYINSRFLPKNTVEKSYTAYTRPRSISTSSSFEEKKRNRDALLTALQNAAKSPTPSYEALRNSKSPVLHSDNLRNIVSKSPIMKPESIPAAKVTKSEKETPSDSSEDEEETEIETDDEIEMETITVITRGTSPTVPSNSSFIRNRRADMARVLQKDITRPKKRKPTLDKEMQSDRLDDTVRYSRFGSSASAIAAPWSSYLDLKYNSPRASYSPVTNRYSGSTYSYKTKDTPSRGDKTEKDTTAHEVTDSLKETTPSRIRSRDNSIGSGLEYEISEKLDVSKSVSEKSVPSKNEVTAPSKSLSDKCVNSKSLLEKNVSSNEISEKNISPKGLSEKSLSYKSASSKSLLEKNVPAKSVSEKTTSSNNSLDKKILEKPLSDAVEKVVPSKNLSEKSVPTNNLSEKTSAPESISEKSMASKSIERSIERSRERSSERSSTELSSSSIPSKIFSEKNQTELSSSSISSSIPSKNLSERNKTELSSSSVSSKILSQSNKSSGEFPSSKCNSKSPEQSLDKTTADLVAATKSNNKNLDILDKNKPEKLKILKKSSSSSSESLNSIPRTNSAKNLKSKDLLKTKSSSSLSTDKSKLQSPVLPKQGSPESSNSKKQLPPIVPKSESPAKTIPANSMGLTQNKDFRKSVLNMNIDGKLVKISPNRSNSVSSDSEPSTGNEINTSLSKSNSKIKCSASLSKLPQRVSKELENRRSPSSESSTTSSSEDDAQKSKKKSPGSSRTSMLLSSADELSLDRPAKPPPSPRVKPDGPKTEAEAKSFIMRALAPVANFFKTTKQEVYDKNWMVDNTETEVPKRRFIQKVESGERAWWLDSPTEEDVQKVRVSPQKEDGKFKFKKQELGEEPWWLNDNSTIPEGVERMVNDGSKMVEVNDGKHCYKIRRNESGQVEWWLDGDKSPEEKSSQSENMSLDGRSSEKLPTSKTSLTKKSEIKSTSANIASAKTPLVNTSSENSLSDAKSSAKTSNKSADKISLVRSPSDGSPAITSSDKTSLETNSLGASLSDKSNPKIKISSLKKSGHKLGKISKTSEKKTKSEQNPAHSNMDSSNLSPMSLLSPPDLSGLHKIRHIDSGERAWWMTSQEEIAEGTSSKKKKVNSAKEISSPKLNKLWHQDSGEKAWWLMSSPNIPDGIQKLDSSDSESSDEEPLGDRASPEGLEMPRETETGRLSPYDNCPGDQKSKRPNTIPLFISRHTNIDDILGGSSQMLSPLMDRIFSFQEKKSGEKCEEVNAGQVMIHDSTAQRGVIQPNRIDVIDGGPSGYGKLDDAALQLYKDGDYGSYLDLEASISEQQEEFEGFQTNKKNSIVLRTQLSVRVHTIIEKLLTSEGRELRRALFSLKQIFQEDKDLVHEFVQNDGLACLIKVGSEADQNYQNYILRALGQVMLYVDGMNGVMEHNQTVQWLYTLIASKFRLVVKTALKLLLVFVEYTDSNCMLLIKAVSSVDQGLQSWSHIMRLLKDFNSADTELLIYAMTLVNKCLNGIPDQDTYYDQTDALEEQGIEGIIQRYMFKQGTDLDLLQQFQMYEAVLQHEDGEDKGMTFRHLDESIRKTLRNRKSVVDSAERRKSRRHSTGNTPLNVNNTNNKLKFYSTQTSTVDDEDESSSSQSSGHNDHNLNGSYKENNKASEVGVTPALRRRRERAERQRSFIREQQETAAILRATLGNTEDTENGNYTNNLQQRITNGQLQISRNSSRKDLTPLMNAVNKLDSSEEGILKKPWVLQMMYGKPDEEVQDENDDNTNENDIKMLIALKRENTVKDLTQKLASQNILHSPSDEGKINRIGDMSGLISKAKEGLAKSKSKADVLKSPTTECPKSLEVKKSENELKWEELVNSMARPLNLCDMDFTDLASDDESDILTPAATSNGIPPPPPPLCDNAPPPPPNSNRNPPPFPTFGNRPQRPCQELSKSNSIKKNKKTVKLFWKEVRDDPINITKVQKVGGMIWDELNPVSIDTQKLEHLFESRAKDLISKKQQELNKNKEIIVLDHKRSNAINIGMTKLPPPRSIKTAILKMDATIMNREGIEKLLTMLPTEEERTKIQDAQAANPDLPLGSAEQFLLTLASISELPARLKLWAFKLDFENSEREIAEPLMDLKQGIELLKCNKTFRGILSTLLSIGCFLNGAEVKGFQIEYLAKVPEVKDTVHKHSLLHHLCHIVMEKFPEATDLYSEIGAITRASKIDFDELALNIHRLESDCKASWDHLKLIAKHDGSTMMKVKMQDFLADCAERIILLDIVHRRVMNRYHKFLLWLGIPLHRISDSKPNEFCRVVSEFALEYRTTRERVLQQLEKKANHRERNKTRGKMITEVGKFRSKEDRADAELRQLLGSDISDVESMQGTLPWRRTRRDHHLNSTVIGVPNGNLTDDGDDEILESLVKTATKAASTRTTPRERKRTRHADRKSLKRSRTRENNPYGSRDSP